MAARRTIRIVRLRTALLVGAAIAASAAAAAPPDLRALVDVTDISALSPSPDGRHLAFRTDRASIERNSYDLGWHVLDLAGETVRGIGSAGEPIAIEPGRLAADAPVWSPDGRWIYFRALSAGAVQIWRSAVDGSASEAVTAEEGDVVALERAPNGGGILYQVGPPRREIQRAEEDEYEQGILVDEHVELGQNLFRGAIINGRHATQRLTGNWFTRGGLLWAVPPRTRRLDFKTLAVADAAGVGPAPAQGQAAPETLARSDSGDTASSVWDGGEGSLVVERADKAKTHLSCPIAECRSDRVAWAAWRPGRDQLVFATGDRAIVATLRLWDLVTGKVRTIARGDGLLNGGRDENKPCAVTASQALCVSAAPNAPPRLEAFDLDSGSGRAVFDPNADLRARNWPRAERLSWRSAEGREFTGVLFIPDGTSAAPRPLFINYYRCEGFIRGGVGDEWPFAVLAAKGIVSVCVNATRMGGAQDGVGQYRAALGGLEALVDHLLARGFVDRKRIGMGGLSFGSEVTMWTLAHSELLSAASIASPQFSPSTYWLNGVRGRDYAGILRQVWGLGAPDEMPDQWRLVAPALHVERIRAPLLMQLPEQESRYQAEFYAKLTNSTTPTELYVFPDEPHIKVQPRHRLAVYRRNLDWFRFWLQQYVDPDPAKADQYRRWRSLAERFAGAAQLLDRSQSSSETRSNTRK
jgi:dipeptidyl aminopeptidase/acylaminoacyl peptidase